MSNRHVAFIQFSKQFTVHLLSVKHHAITGLEMAKISKAEFLQKPAGHMAGAAVQSDIPSEIHKGAEGGPVEAQRIKKCTHD